MYCHCEQAKLAHLPVSPTNTWSHHLSWSSQVTCTHLYLKRKPARIRGWSLLDPIIGSRYLCLLFQAPGDNTSVTVMVTRSGVGCSWLSFFLLRVLPAVVLILLLPSGIATHQKWYQKSRPLPRPSIMWRETWDAHNKLHFVTKRKLVVTWNLHLFEFLPIFADWN